jgi:hypothetical protein
MLYGLSCCLLVCAAAAALLRLYDRLATFCRFREGGEHDAAGRFGGDSTLGYLRSGTKTRMSGEPYFNI